MIKKAKSKKKHGGPAGPSGKLTSFVDGMGTLPRALAEKLGTVVRTGCGVVSVRKDTSFLLALENGETVSAETVVMSNPAWSAATQIAGLNPDLAAELSPIYYPPVLVVATGFDAASLQSVPNGFGFLVPRNQGVRILGCLWSSSVWNHRAPDGKVLLRTMVGGSVDAAAAQMNDDDVAALVRSELNKTMGIKASPELVKVFRYPKAIAQYECGHTQRMKRIEAAFLSTPGLFLSGSSYGGISVNHCIDEAPKVAKAVLSSLK